MALIMTVWEEISLRSTSWQNSIPLSVHLQVTKGYGIFQPKTTC
jgi:hypothetical protein